eukprot:1027986-Amphidinium_carterae.2
MFHGAPSATNRCYVPAGGDSAAQSSRAVRERVHRQVAIYGNRPTLSAKESFHEILRCKDMYSVDQSNVAEYTYDKVTILTAGVEPKDVETVLPGPLIPIVQNPEAFILRSEQELTQRGGDDDIIRPYWDPTLAGNAEERRRLILRLNALGLVGFRRKIRCQVGMFTVHKKNGTQRLIVDARQANRVCRRPPHGDLGTVTALTQVWTPRRDPEEISAQGHGASVDLYNGFYQFRARSLGSLFGIDFPERAEVWGIDSVFNEETGREEPIRKDELVFAVFEGLPMGFSWSLFLCNETISYAGLRAGCTRLHGRRPAPSLDEVVVSPYVDNVNVLGHGKEAVKQKLEATMLELHEFRLHEVEPASVTKEMVGIILDGESAQFRPKPSRVWRLFLALEHVLSLRKMTEKAMQVLVGHLVNHFQLLRPALSVLDSCYRFIGAGTRNSKALDHRVRWELRVCQGLVFMAGHSFSLRPCPMHWLLQRCVPLRLCSACHTPYRIRDQ